MNPGDGPKHVKSSTPRVLDILQKFEPNATSSIPSDSNLSPSDLKNANSKQSPILLKRGSVTKNAGNVLFNRNTTNYNVNSNSELRKLTPPVHRKLDEGNQHLVSVSERTRIFQDLGNSVQSPPFVQRLSLKKKTDPISASNAANFEKSDFEPIPQGPAPPKPPRTFNVSPEKKLSHEISANTDLDGNVEDLQMPVNRPVPAIRKKRVNPEISASKSEQTSTESKPNLFDELKARQSSSFLHDRFENLTVKSSEAEKGKMDIRQETPNNKGPLQRQASVPSTHPNKVNAGSVRRKDVPRPKNPPPKPPPPNLANYRGALNEKNQTALSETVSKPAKAVSPSNLLNVQRSHSEENLYAVPITSTGRSSEKMVKIKSLPKNEYAAPYEVLHLKRKEPEELHYMSSPVPGFEQKKVESTPKSQRKVKTAIKDIINQSFSVLKKTFTTKSGDLQEESIDDSDEENDVSVDDVRERIIYVQSIKRKPEPTPYVTSQPHLFEYLLVIGLEWIDKASKKNHPVVYAQFPEQIDFKHDKSLIAKFCYPDSDRWNPVSDYQSETYSFVLTDDKGAQTFAYCKRTLPPSEEACTPIVYCLVCSERDFHFYKKLLDVIERKLNQTDVSSSTFLEDLHDKNLPRPGEVFYCAEDSRGNEFSIQRSADAQTENVEFSHLLKALNVEVLIKSFSLILMERRVLFCANTLTVLTQCVQAMAALLYPFTWQHTLVPVVPETMLDLCSLPAPFVMGVLTNCVDKVKELPLEDVLIVDLDYSRIVQETVDVNTTIIPRKIRLALFTALTLANSMTDPTAMNLTTVMSESFVRMFVHLVGHYENHVFANPDGTLQFERESFCKAPYSRGIQMFLKWFCETQTFEVFMNKRLTTTALHLKSRRETDLFERRCEEHRIEMDQLSQTFKGNVREIGKKVKDFSDKLRNFM